MMTPHDILSANGPLQRQISGYTERPQQLEMAEAVRQALEHHHTILAEAETGTGKTFAYLIPALLSGERVLFSTGTRALQDQLYHNDLPRVLDAIDHPVRTALLKGRSNYLCLHRLQSQRKTVRFSDRHQVQALQSIVEWSIHTGSGDIAELSSVPENSPVWSIATSNADNCLGSQCDHFNDCHLMTARRRAQEADAVVINHHLFFADLALKQEGFGDLLPGAAAIVFDEAHQIPDIATMFLSQSLSTRQLSDLCRDTLVEADTAAVDSKQDLHQLAADIENAITELKQRVPISASRGNLAQLHRDMAFAENLSRLDLALAKLKSWFEVHGKRSKELEHCSQRLLRHSKTLDKVSIQDGDHINWYESTKRSMILHSTPIDISHEYREIMNALNCTQVYTSATLSVAGRFDHYTSTLGLVPDRSFRWNSPFDFARNTLLYLPMGLPEPSSPAYTSTLLEQAIPVIQAAGGRSFLLFTSYRALNQAAAELQNRLPYPLLVQGQMPRNQLLERFRQLGNAVLLGTASFWEGVDVRGEALSCVIIDKLPFASPTDPVMQARIQTLRSQGREPFMELQIPQAVITLRQGVGRLIRDVADRGVLMLCDPRLINKRYGRVFLDSLPPMRRSRRIEDVCAFFDNINQTQPTHDEPACT